MGTAALTLTGSDRVELLTRLRSKSSDVVQRARVVLLTADGMSSPDVAEWTGLSLATVGKWRSRFARLGIAGLADRPRTGAPRTVDREQVLAASVADPPQHLGITHWTSHGLAAHLGIGGATVARIWREHAINGLGRGHFVGLKGRKATPTPGMT